jgi:vancomycin resistance protein VanJ
MADTGAPVERAERTCGGARRLDRAVLWFAWGSLALLLLQPVAAGLLPPVTAFHNVRHLVLPLLIPLGLFALVRCRRATLPALACVGVWAFLVGGWLAPQATPGAGGADLRVLSLNLGDERSDPHLVERALVLSGADVVLLQEVAPRNERHLARALASLFPHQAWHPNGLGGKALLSRLPLVREELLTFPDGSSALDATLDVDGRALRVLCVHHRAWTAATGRLGSGVRGVEDWARERVRAGEAALVVGDLNSTPGSGVLRALEELGLACALEEAGAAFTFPVAGRYRGWPGGPMFAVDHVLAGPGLESVDAWVGEDASSDHLPVAADLRFRR